MSGRIAKLEPQSQDNLHLTVCFVGLLEASVLDRLLALREEIQVSEFTVELGEVTALDLSHSSCWCIEAKPFLQLYELHRLVKGLLVKNGFLVDHGSYRPHITIGWAKSVEAVSIVDECLSGELLGVSFVAREIGVYVSQVEESDKSYKKLGSIVLAGEEPEENQEGQALPKEGAPEQKAVQGRRS